MKHVYVAGPFRAETPWMVECNVRAAELVALELAQLGAVPVCPHTMFRHFDKSAPDEFWLEATLSLLDRCDAIVMLPNWRNSVGSVVEEAEARKRGMSILYLNVRAQWFGQIEEWVRGTNEEAAA